MTDRLWYRLVTARNRQISQPITVDDIAAVVGTSIGLALYPEDAADAGALIRIADQAIYSVRQSGKNGFALLRRQRLD